MQTGYVAPYSATEARRQVVVVVFEDWTVICYDSSLRVLWSKQVAHNTFDLDHLIKFYRVDTAAIDIVPLQLKDDAATGTVIVGASMVRRDALAGVSRESDERILRSLAEGTHPEVEALAKLSHFSVFALDSRLGHVLWKHDGMEMRAEQFSRSLPQHAYTLDVKDLMTKTHHAAGINDWMVFRQSLVDELPHFWAGAEDTSMRIAHFIRRHIGATVEQVARPPRRDAGKGKKVKALAARKRGEHKDTSAGSGRNGRPATGLGSLPLLQGEVSVHSLAKSATLPHNAAEHTENPNVIVVHTENGLEVIALRTGVPITSLALPPGKVYADVDGDGVVDTIVVLDNPNSVNKHRTEFAHHQYEFSDEAVLQHCMIVVMSGLPARSQLFNGTVCADRPSLRDFSSHSETRTIYKVKEPPGLKEGETPGMREEHSSIVHAIPIVLHKLDPKTLKESKVKDIIVAVHDGVVTSYSGTGNFNWQVRNAPRWATEEDGELSAAESLTVASVSGFDSDADRASDLGSHDSVYSNILIVGESEIQLVSREGDGLATAELPKPPLAYPILGDFDNDGVTDIIITTKGAVLGYHVHVVQANNTILVVLLVLVAVAVVVFVANIQRVSPAEIAQAARGIPASVLERQSASAAAHTLSGRAAQASRVPRSKAAAGGVFQIVRSTDDHHLD